MQRFTTVATVVALLAAAGVATGVQQGQEEAPVVEFPITVPDAYKVEGTDAYICVVKALPDAPYKLVGVKPLADESVVHHILLYGCSSPAQQPPPGETIAWDCFHHGVCGSGGSQILYGWGRNAPQLALPHTTALSVGGGTNIRYIVTQVHFKADKPPGDRSGVMLQLRQHPTLFSTGIITFAAGFTIPPNTKSTKISVECCYQAHQPVTTLAFRVHAHTLGRSITMERQAWNKSGTEVVATNNPLLPQAFYPVAKRTVIWPGDRLKVTCDFDSTGRMRETHAGNTNDDEMCNMYMMIYAPHPFLSFCAGADLSTSDDMPGVMPKTGSMVPDPCLFWKPPGRGLGATQALGAAAGAAGGGAEGGHATPQALGSVSGVAVGGDGSLWAFYRGDRVWTGSSFDASFRLVDRTPLPAAVLVQLNPETGAVVDRMGSHLFGMPHMITIDSYRNIWAVDAGLHTVVKLDRKGKVALAVGTPGEPGSGPRSFCQPTHVAVARDGSFYVADGYCNSRVAKFDANGTFLGEAQIPAAAGARSAVVHSVLLDECGRQLYVAARETGQVVVVDTESLAVKQTVDLSAHGRVWSVVMGPYGAPLALVWNQGKDGAVVDLKTMHAWALPGTAETFPHQMALGAAPQGLSGAADRLFAVYVAPTCERGCGALQRFVLVPQGMKLPDVSTLRPALTRAGNGSRPAGASGGGAALALGDVLGTEDDETDPGQQQQQQQQQQQPRPQPEDGEAGAGTPGQKQGAAGSGGGGGGATVVVRDRHSDPATHTEFGTVLAVTQQGRQEGPGGRPLEGWSWGARVGACVVGAAALAGAAAVLSGRLSRRGAAGGPAYAPLPVVRPHGRKGATFDEVLARSVELEGLEEGGGGSGGQGLHARAHGAGGSPAQPPDASAGR